MCKYPLPNRTATALAAYSSKNINPGLLMDMLAAYPFPPKENGQNQCFATFDQENGQKPHLNEIVKAAAAFKDTGNEMLKRWESDIKKVADADWELATIWRLAAHLSRSTAMENAALCMHPVYGFPYLPGSGLKGVARAFAELEGKTPQCKIDRIFGTTDCVGQIVFLEAWPAEWPELQVDILNNHHTEYYTSGGQENGDVTPPGDWESPIPVYFLTVAPRMTFRFALRKAHAGVCDKDLVMAKKWLTKGLAQLGFGAKTAAGYGYFGAPETATETATPPEATPLEEKKTEFVAWAKKCATTTNARFMVTHELPQWLKKLPDDLSQWAKETLLEALKNYPELCKKGKRGKPSLADWITSCQPNP